MAVAWFNTWLEARQWCEKHLGITNDTSTKEGRKHGKYMKDRNDPLEARIAKLEARERSVDASFELHARLLTTSCAQVSKSHQRKLRVDMASKLKAHRGSVDRAHERIDVA